MGNGATGRSVSAPSLHLSRGENSYEMVQLNGSEEIADFPSEENWWNRTNSKSRVEAADALNDDENDGLSDRFASHIPHHIAMMPIGDEEPRTKPDSHVCAIFSLTYSPAGEI